MKDDNQISVPRSGQMIDPNRVKILKDLEAFSKQLQILTLGMHQGSMCVHVVDSIKF